MAAVLACGDHAVLSHHSAAALWGIRAERGKLIHVTAPADRGGPGLVAHRRTPLVADVERTTHRGIPVTTPALTIVDLAAAGLGRDPLEAAVNEADVRGLIDPEALRAVTEAMRGRHGAARLRTLLDRRTFRLTRSQLERRFFPIAERAGLRTPETRVHLCGFEVDFYWPELALVIETDGLAFHRTPQRQAKDRLRDQALTGAGYTVLRFTHEQIVYEAEWVAETLRRVAVSAPRAA